MDAVSPQDVYARHLVSRRGYPLWTPSLSLPGGYRQRGLKIGDVGVVVPEDGSFDVFFNICLPSTQLRGVPDNFTPVQLEDEDIAIFPQAESAGRVISTRSVVRIGQQAPNENTSSAVPQDQNYEFFLSSEGSLLILPEGAERYYLRDKRSFLEEAVQHAVDWYNFAEDRLGRVISHDSLYLITGFFKTRSWSLASYQQDSGIDVVYAQFKAAQVSGGDVSRSYVWETTPHTLDWRVGPSEQYYNGTSNQSVFIQGFKIAVRSSILGTKRVKVKADFPSVRPPRVTFYSSVRRSSHARLSSSQFNAPVASTSRATDAELHADMPEVFDSDGSTDDDEDITVQHIPQALNPFHPSDIINRYLLRSHPSAGIAITHDSQWIMLLERELITPEELSRQDVLEELVWNMLAVSREGVVYLQDISTDHAAEPSTSSNEIIGAQEASITLPAEQPDSQIEAPGISPREIPNEVQLADPHESKSSGADQPAGTIKPLRSILKKRKDVRPCAAPEPRDAGPYFIPETPKLRKLSLPEESRHAATPKLERLSLQEMPSAASILSIGQSSKPSKSILKGIGSEPSDLYESGPSAKRVTHYTNPGVSPSRVRFLSTKPPAFSLNWILLPYDPRRSRRLLRFDMAFPVDGIVFQDRGFRTKVSDAELDAPAADGLMTKMRILFEHGPFNWNVNVENAQGIRCRGVFEAIYDTFNVPLTLDERMLIHDQKAVDAAFQLRCKLVMGLSEVERSRGWKRVDVLVHGTIFLGLTQPKSGGDWVLNLGDHISSPM